MKRMLALLLALLMLPLSAQALEMEQEKNYVSFPELDGLRLRFRSAAEWTIVTRDNLEEHMALVTARGGTEQEARDRFARDTLLFEAYWPHLPEDACIRMERFTDDASRSVWHLKHLSSKERKALLETVNDGLLLPDYDTYAASYKGNGGNSWIHCSFTNYPPAVHESGAMEIRYMNGHAYVLTYSVYGRAAGRSNLRLKGENQVLQSKTPFYEWTLKSKQQPQLAAFALDEAFPIQVDTGTLQVSGSVAKGGKLTIAVDGRSLKCKVNAKGHFTAEIPLDGGDHEVVFTATQKKRTDNVTTYTVNASADRTPLSLTRQPETVALAGEQTVAGVTAPGAEVVLRLDDRDPVTLTADAGGAFAHTFDVNDDLLHEAIIAAHAPGKDVSILALPFATVFESVKEGTDAFEKQLTAHTLAELAADPAAHRGERVKISVRLREISYTPEGLGILATHNVKGKQPATPLYLTVSGYAQDSLYEDMTITIYATVAGEKQLDGESRLHLQVQYGTWLVAR